VGYHVDSGEKKRDHFRRGLNTVRADRFNELVNLAISQEDCIVAHRAEKKSRAPMSGPSSPPRGSGVSPAIRAEDFSSRQEDGLSGRLSSSKHPTAFQLPPQGTINPSNNSSSSSAREMETNASHVAMWAIIPRIARGISRGRCQHQIKTEGESRKCKSDRGSSISLLWRSYLKEPPS
jgi:hypothetical protein